VKGKTQAWPEVVRQVELDEEVEEQVEEEDKGAEGHVELENGQQQEPDDDVVPTLWQWLKMLQGSHSSLISCSWEKLWPQ